MDNHSHQQSNGYGLYGQGHSRTDHNANELQVPTVQEALAYTPFNSVFPFSPGMCEPSRFNSITPSLRTRSAT